MNQKWIILFTKLKDHHHSIPQFINSCSKKHQVKIIRFFNLLQEFGPTLPRPYADLLRDGIHELRIKLSGLQVRFLYFFNKNSIIMNFVFTKNSDRVPEQFIDKVVSYKSNFLKKRIAYGNV